MIKSDSSFFRAPMQPITKVTVILVFALLPLLWLNASLYAAGNIVVTSTADNGPGTLRQALLDARNGDNITFDPTVFPPGNPATIALTSSALSAITQGNLTIDGSAAGVIMDGSGLGGPPEFLLLDDVSLTLDSGANQIANGDFSAGLGHWRPSPLDGPGATRSLETVDFHSSPASYRWGVVARSKDTATVYDTEDISSPHDSWPYNRDSTAWITATGGSEVVLRFWHKGEAGEIEFWALDVDGRSDEFDEGYFDDSSTWKETAVTVTLPSEAIAMAFQFELEHPNWRDYHGLQITSDDNVIRGLQITGFPVTGIHVTNGASRNTIAQNVIGNNGEGGLFVGDSDTLSNTIIGNYIGINAAGMAAAPNRGESGGILIEEARFTIIGGPSAEDRNVISGNDEHGLTMVESSDNTIIGNYIGTDAGGTAALPNKGHGIVFESANQNGIGPDNIVAYNGKSGIFVIAGIENRITQNAIFSNTLKGIKLQEGGNLTLTAPVLIQAGASTVTGQAPTSSSVEIFSDAGDEGQYYHGTTTADAGGNFTFTQSAGFTGTNVTATATDGDGNTSEFSLATAHNVAPVVTPPEDQTAIEGIANLFALGTFTDPDANSPWQGSVSWGDSSIDTTFSITTTGSLADQSHIYTPTGTYTATVTIDDGINSGDATFWVNVIGVGSVEVAAYEDSNRNGKKDEGEPALPGVTVTLSDETRAATTDTPALKRTEVTGADGTCRFEEVPVGDYTVSFAPLEGYTVPDPALITVKARETTTPDPVMVEREDSSIYLPAVER